MSRTAPVRRSRARAVLLAVVLAATGAGPVPGAAASPGAPVVGIDQVDVAPHPRTAPRGETVVAVGSGGYAHRAEDSDPHSGDPLEWTDFATGESRALGHGSGNDAFGETGTGGRYVSGESGPGAPFVLDLESGAHTPLTVPPDTGYRGLTGDRLLFQQYAAGSSYGSTEGYFLRSAADPDGASTPVTGWPADAEQHTARLVGGTEGLAVLRFGRKGPSSYPSGDSSLGLVDLATGRMQVLEAATAADGMLVAGVAVTAERIAWVDPGRTVHVRSRTGLTADATSYPLPEGLSATRIGLVGDWLLTTAEPRTAGEALTRRLVAVSPAGEARTLLAGAEARINQLGDGSGAAAVTGGTSATDWALLKVVPGKGGVPALEKLRAVEPLPAEVDSLALGMGRLTTLEHDGPRGPGFYRRSLPVGPLHTGQSASVWSGAEAGAEWNGTPLLDAADGRTVSFPKLPYTPRAVVSRRADGQTSRVTVDQSGRIADAFGRWTVFQTGEAGAGELAAGGETLVLDLDARQTVSRRTRTAAALWGDTLFTGTGTAGAVVREDLATGKVLGTVATGAGCPLTELQAAGRWLYWACARYEKQGVLDLSNPAAPVRVALPRGDRRGGLLGDGYFVDRDSGSYLRVTPFSTGTAGTPFALTRAEPVPGERRTTWTVDRFGGAVAYRGADQRVHVVWTDVPASDLTAASRSFPGGLRIPGTWKASWTLSKPAAAHELTIRDARSGKAVRTFRAGETRGRTDVTWNGRDDAGRPVTNGPYVWELFAPTADGRGRDLSTFGHLQVSGGRPAFRDLAGDDGEGELLALDTAGAVSMYRGNGEGRLSGRMTATGRAFPAGTLLVPFGDVDADGCADVLGRVGNELRAYRQGCGKVVTASSPYASIGSGWGQYDVLTSPGDVNGDGYADLVARQTTTGDMYFYAGTADRGLKARLRIGVNWKLYQRITGAGDLDGDGRGDLLAVDGSGTLWSYFGTATGGVTPRAKVGGGWQVYTAVQTVGDLDADGDADLVARDAAGRLYAYYSHGLGRTGNRFGPRELVGTGGWNTFRTLH
ncbi:FG-GAP-like repeat-containing protein [Streptomyces omiyaensis]|uniref:FG-GAP-like repeat-containing protein n=1 Tax=Streptomyces omiyaensis TaxID=68247 RepID=A0ABW7C058_9ACTN|nr:FG-GAP-like repeat-containing protein [Streptomyces omiyaensis]GGY71913.1 hypothetical protein GCM10010363_61570 [Streptomyces omiyaensis]